MLSWPRALLLVSAFGALPALAVACQPTLPAPELCGEIPSGGCPVGRGGTCDDPTCGALYDCVDGNWTRTETCAPPDGGGGGGGAPGDGGDGGPDADACTPFMFDHTGEMLDCMPDLENPPDCPAAAAEGCLETACLVGC